MVPNLPQQYIFFLKCCFQQDCVHSICKKGSHDILHWYPGGPLLSFFPLPVPDPTRPWGASKCITCKGTCSGHYQKPEDNLVNLQLLGNHATSLTPSTVITETSKNYGGTMSDDQTRELASKTLLSTDEVHWYVEHLENVQQNRKKGARKATETEQEKSSRKARVTVRALLNVGCVVKSGRRKQMK